MNGRKSERSLASCQEAGVDEGEGRLARGDGRQQNGGRPYGAAHGAKPERGRRRRRAQLPRQQARPPAEERQIV